MDTRTLETFVTAAEFENYRMAAETLYITQPAVTFQIRQLEKEIGEKLFVKSGRQMMLTRTGRLFYQEAKMMLAQYEKSLEHINRFRQGYDQSISVAISPLLADTILPSVLRAYTKQFPNVELSIQVLESYEIAPVVANGRVDIGLSCLPGPSDVHTLKFHEEPIALVCTHDGYDAESGPVIDAKALLEKHFIFTDNHPDYWSGLKKQLKQTLPSYKFLQVTQSHITKRFVLEGIGVSFLPKSIINRDIMEGRLLEVPVPFMDLPSASMYIVYKYEHELESKFAAFVSNFHFS